MGPLVNNPAREDDTEEDRERQGGGTVLACRTYLFVILEADRILSGGARFCLEGIDEVVITRGRERTAVREQTAALKRLVLSLPSRRVSGMHARLQRNPEGWILTDTDSTNGCYVNGVRLRSAVLASNDILEIGRVFLKLGVSLPSRAQSVDDLDGRELADAPQAMATLLPHLASRYAELSRVSRSAVTITLSGATGTGKEVLARAVHERSGRAGPLVGVNCGALPEALVESLFFGHTRGTFSGAHSDSLGFIRSAEGGTLLLDEVQELRAAAQTALLRVLQEREVTPIGSSRPQRVDVRFIATSPVPLRNAVDAGTFRADLFSRLNGFAFDAPPLRDRCEDLGLFVAALLRKAGVTEADKPAFMPNFGLRLLRHAWPLNVRELEQLLARSWALANGGIMDAGQFDADVEPLARSARSEESVLAPEELELRDRLLREMSDARGNVAQVARAMGKAPMQVHRWMKRFAVDPARYRRGDAD
jgi:sigma-54 dependent transcriptional regulator, acetoin dehydrogenase operon transcriptional activator AcoR